MKPNVNNLLTHILKKSKFIKFFLVIILISSLGCGNIFYQIEVKSPDKAEKYILNKIQNKELIMGFGHRVYRNGDSRVPTMTEYYYKTAEFYKNKNLPEISKILEETMLREKNIKPNLDFPAGPTYYLMGFDIDFFTPIFIVSRITGWAAHVMEQFDSNKLIRPLSKYTGAPHRQIEK